jgi:diadenosine tetraphosphatase ApaH/serine/threonine PP2A family protein phosphatase
VRACPQSSLRTHRPLRPLTTVHGGCQRESRHVELAGLRDPQRLVLHSPSRAAEAQVAYGVPRGWLFRHVSCCPHYSAEVLL